MTPRHWVIFALAGLLVVAGTWIYVNHKESQVAQAIQESAELKGKVDALSQESQTHKTLADQAGQKAEAEAKTVAELKAKLAKVQNAKPSQPSAPVDGNPVDVPPIDAADGLKDQIIDAQDKEIGTLKVEVSELRASLAIKDQALVTSERRARVLEIALETERSAAKTGKWIGRIQGFAIGFGVSYAVGRLQK